MTTIHPETPETAPAAPPPSPPAPDDQTRYKNPIVAAILSVFPGVGNLYNGLYLRGLAFFMIFTSMIVLTANGHPLFGLGIAFFWIFNVVDAYRQAILINHGYGDGLGLEDPPQISHGQGGVIVGAIMFLLGAFALADMYIGPINVDWLIDLWPVFLMAIGGWLIFDTLRDKKKKQAEAADTLD